MTKQSGLSRPFIELRGRTATLGFRVAAIVFERGEPKYVDHVEKADHVDACAQMIRRLMLYDFDRSEIVFVKRSYTDGRILLISIGNEIPKPEQFSELPELTRDNLFFEYSMHTMEPSESKQKEV